MADRNQNSALFQEGFDVERELLVRALCDTITAIDAGIVGNDVAVKEVALSLGRRMADAMQSDIPGPAIGGRVQGVLMTLVVLAIEGLRAMPDSERMRGGQESH